MLLLKKNNCRYLVAVFILFMLPVVIQGCVLPDRKVSQERQVIGTFVRVDVCREGHEQKDMDLTFEEIWARFEEIEMRMNAYDSASEIGQINAADGKAVVVHQDVYNLVKQGVLISQKTQGVFNLTVMPLIELWRQAEQRGRVPTPEEVREAKERVGIERIQFFSDAGELKIACQGCQIDLGGFAKGYAVDEAARILRQHGFEDFMIDAGGDMYVSGQNCRNRKWRIAIQHPRIADQWADVVEAGNTAVTTSGDYQQFYEIGDKVFSHIMNPLTGYPQKDIVSATVIAPTALEADVLSTALTIWPVQKGIAFIDDLGQGYAALVLRERKDGSLEHIPTKDYYLFQSKEYAQ